MLTTPRSRFSAISNLTTFYYRLDPETTAVVGMLTNNLRGLIALEQLTSF